ncbi:MAG TPA: hypothetical protein VJZ01_13490 [Lachnospiraceae bacterium]|jgi:hypothetical protein|nr:hypothetical protein [Lachnospiraceae bacterium]
MSRRIIKIGIAVIGLLTVMCITARTVTGTEQKPDIPSTDAYESMEAEHLAEIKTVLAQNSYKNSGVNMTKVIEADENRSYSVHIYHARLSQADDETKQDLLEQLEALDGFGQYCTITYDIAS